jgi:hypothetical protein
MCDVLYTGTAYYMNKIDIFAQICFYTFDLENYWLSQYVLKINLMHVKLEILSLHMLDIWFRL